MPDICDLILEQHHQFRLRFAELDGMRDAGGDELAGVWAPLADLLEAHAAAEEELFYPRLLDLGDEPVEETEDAITDHDDITEAVDRSGELAPGSDEWWEEIGAAWLTWHGEHAGGFDRDGKDLVDYVEEHGDTGQADEAEEMAD